jgi:hypothetical protein
MAFELIRLKELRPRRADAVPRLPAAEEKRPTIGSPSRKFIGGEPMKPATNKLAGAF